jgi:hypothetical protein
MNANELVDKFNTYDEPHDWGVQAQAMLRQQAQEIEALRKELALQRLSNIGQEIEDRDSAIYATGYWNGIEYKRMRELTDGEIRQVIFNLPNKDLDLIEFAKAILKKASERA